MYSILSLAKEGEIKLPHLFKNSLQGDSVCAKLFSTLGVSTTSTKDGIILNKINQTENKFEYDFLNCPDIAQTLAVCCAAKNVEANLKGLQTLSIKETDRIVALKTELGRFGVETITSSDSLQINSKFKAQNLKIESYIDHRMAMSFAPLALICNTIEIQNPNVVEKSFPHFWEELKNIGFIIR